MDALGSVEYSPTPVDDVRDEPPAASPPAALEGQVLARQVGVVVMGRIAAAAAEVLLPILLVRFLDKLSVAVLAYVLLLYGTVATIVATGLPESVLYFLAGKSPGQRRRTVRRLALILGAFGGLVALGFLGFWAIASWTGAVEARMLRFIPWLVPYALFDLPSRLLPHLLVAESRHRQSAWFSMLDSGSQLVAVLVPAGLGAPLWVPFAALSACAAVKLGVLWGAMRWFYRGGGGDDAAPVSVGAIFRYALPLGLSEITSILNQRFDRFLVAALFTSAQFADYFVGAWQIPVVTIIPFAAGNVLMPRFTELFQAGRGAEAVALWRLSAEKICLIILPVAVLFVVSAEETVALLFGSSYSGAAWVFRIYTLVLLGRVAAYGNMLAAAGRTRDVLYATSLGLVVNVVASVPLAYIVGFTGAAWGTVAAFVVIVGYYLRQIGRSSGVPVRQVFPFARWAQVLGVCGAAAGPAVAFKLLVPAGPGLALAGEAVAMLVTYSVLGTVLGLIRRADWAYVRDWLSLRGLRSAEGRGT
ncbi:MAG: polysaccharide biosynthesis C-terminal domain-containing protein [Deltaproteobacteria bacterium]|nr:polysaccharide biosynthesis C-terminal domain-containing protein [Deltaproteobacteria bacterium]